ncbi:hypothetical protein ACFQZE_07340 [Paenibacillus sp. GCM10027627]|uniref:hypothetical protein n=1 Tax=unclassified Paenibacillus TaxID=185978 RepID=UPI003641F729
MAIKKNTSVYGVSELNKVAAVKTGQHFTQYVLDGTDFVTTPAENGMLLVIDHVAKKIKKATAVTQLVGLHSSVEKIYENEKGRKHFSVKIGDFNPRVYTLSVGDVFETNTFQYDDTVYADFAAIKAAINATTVFGVAGTNGYIDVKAATTPTAVVELKAVEAVVLPNGENGIKWVVAKA